MNKVAILNVKNAAALPSFEPVEGQWFVNGISGERSYDEIVSAIESHFTTQFPITVQLFHDNGHAISGETPSSGTFLATRKRG